MSVNFRDKLLKYIFKIDLSEFVLFENLWGNSNFNGKIVRTNKWNGFDNLENFLKNGNKDEYTEDSISYDINEFNFRTSPDTNDIIKENLVACFGCSNTFGQGLRWDETWPYQLNQLLGDEWITKNYGQCGGSFNQISRLVYNYFLTNKAKIVCCFFPEILRLELFYNNNFHNFSPSGNPDIDINAYNKYIDLSSIQNCLYFAIKDFKFIESICKINNAKLYWFTWSKHILEMPEDKIHTFFNYENFLSGITNHAYELNYFPRARDNKHFGKKVNKIIAEKFYDKIINDK